MKKSTQDKVAYVCTRCGHDSAKWFGRCPACGEYNTVSEIKVAPAAAPRRERASGAPAARAPMRLSDVPARAEPRFASGLEEADRVLGGGVVPGSIVLVGGDPGIGKSTLLLQVADAVSRNGRKVLYVSGEESP